MFFYDWLACYQDFDYQLPIVADDGYVFVDLVNDEYGKVRQNRIHHEGSYSTSIVVHVKDNRLVVSGNPSRFNRLENLFGYTSLDACFAVYNNILRDLGLPEFAKCSRLGHVQSVRADGSVKLTPVVNGAVITTLHITSNQAVGAGCVDTYLKALSSQSYLHRRARLHPDGKTTDWLSDLGNAREIYPSVYDKAHELAKHALPNIKRKFGDTSDEYNYLNQIIEYCRINGVTRHELKLNSPYLKKHNLCYYGLSDFSSLSSIFSEFMDIDQKLKVNHMDLITITQSLLDNGICANTKSANAIALYAINWMNGKSYTDEIKAATNGALLRARAALRKIGIDIAKPCNILTFSPVIVREVKEITRQPLKEPSFYRPVSVPLRLVA